MEEVSIVGVDLAKQVFQVHGAASDGRVLFRKKLSRLQFPKFMATLPPCVVAMEACGTAHYWGRELAGLGHDVRLIPPVYVKAFVKRQKNDAADAEAVAEAAMRPTMRTVAVKTSNQQARAMLFRTRDLLVGQRTQMVNALRGDLAEHGVIVGKGLGNVERLSTLGSGLTRATR
jgi:transposase